MSFLTGQLHSFDVLPDLRTTIRILFDVQTVQIIAGEALVDDEWTMMDHVLLEQITLKVVQNTSTVSSMTPVTEIPEWAVPILLPVHAEQYGKKYSFYLVEMENDVINALENPQEPRGFSPEVLLGVMNLIRSMAGGNLPSPGLENFEADIKARIADPALYIDYDPTSTMKLIEAAYWVAGRE